MNFLHFFESCLYSSTIETSLFFSGQMQQTQLFNLSKFYPNNKAAEPYSAFQNQEPYTTLFFFFFNCGESLTVGVHVFMHHHMQTKHFQCSLDFCLTTSIAKAASGQTEKAQTDLICLFLPLLRPLTEQQCGEIPAHEQRSTTVPLLCKIRYSLV